MTDTYRDFDAALREQRHEPIRFRLGGEDFAAAPRLPIGILMAAVTEGLQGAEQLIGFVRSVLTDDEGRARWDALVQRRDTEVDLATVNDVVDWLVETYTARPTKRPSGLPESAPPTSVTSKARSKRVSLERGTAEEESSVPALAAS